MNPIKFPEVNTTYAKDQPVYLALPCYKSPSGNVVTCWQLTFWERFKILISGKLWLTILTFNHPLQPLKPSVEKPYPELYCEETISHLTKKTTADFKL